MKIEDSRGHHRDGEAMMDWGGDAKFALNPKNTKKLFSTPGNDDDTVTQGRKGGNVKVEKSKVKILLRPVRLFGCEL
jgi:hypothetical protein